MKSRSMMGDSLRLTVRGHIQHVILRHYNLVRNITEQEESFTINTSTIKCLTLGNVSIYEGGI